MPRSSRTSKDRRARDHEAARHTRTSVALAASMRRRRAGPAPAAVRSRPRKRQTSNAEAAPKSAWGVQAQRRRATHVAQHRPGPRASIDARPRWRLTDCAGRTREAGQPFGVAHPALRKFVPDGLIGCRDMSDSRFARSAGLLRSFPVPGRVALATVAGACNAKPGAWR
jgi:hypothetical protein